MPVTRYTCPGCTAVVKTPAPLAAGKQIKCPRCAQIFAALVAAAPAKVAAVTPPAAMPAGRKETQLAAAAKETTIAAQKAKATQLAAAGKESKIVAPQAKTTQLAAGAAKETKIVAQQAKPTKLAAANVKETKRPATQAKETKLAPPAGKPPTAATPASVNGGVRAEPFQITCPKCRATAAWKAGSPPPIGKRIKCPRCTTVYVVPAPKSKAVSNAAAKPQTAAAMPKHGELPRVIRYACPACKAVLKTATPLAAGKAIKCPRCQRTFAVTGKKPAFPPTKSGPTPPTQSTRDTKLILPSSQAMPKPAKTTPLAPPTGKTTPAKRPVGRMPCPACKAVLKFVGLPPPGKAVKCPKCAKSFQVRAKKKTARPASSPAALSRTPGKAPSLKTSPSVSPTTRPPARRPTIASVPLPAAKRCGRRSLLIGLVVMALLSVGLYAWLAGYGDREIPESAWVEFTPPDGRCRVLMPGLPDADVATVSAPGLVSGQKFTVFRDEGGASFMLTCSEHSAEITGRKTFDKLYPPLRDHMLDKVEGSLTQESDVVFNGQLGKEFQVALTKGGLLIGRVYLVRGQAHDRFYILLGGGKHFQPGQGDAAKFFNSFKLDASAGPANRPEKRGRIRTADAKTLASILGRLT